MSADPSARRCATPRGPRAATAVIDRPDPAGGLVVGDQRRDAAAQLSGYLGYVEETGDGDGLLQLMAITATDMYTVTELAKRLDVPVTTLHREAQRLVDADLIRSRTVGRSRLLRPNPAHRAAAPLTQLLQVTFGPHTVIEDEFDSIRDVARALIYGSWAARYHGARGAPPADLDVLVIGSPDRAAPLGSGPRPPIRSSSRSNPAQRSSSLTPARARHDTVAPRRSRGRAAARGRPSAAGHRRSGQRRLLAREGPPDHPDRRPHRRDRSRQRFGGMRRRRNELEYPNIPNEEASQTEAQRAIDDARTLINAAEQILPGLSLF